MATDETAFMSVSELGRAYRAGTLSPVDVVTAALQRLEALEPGLNAVAHRLDVSARAEAGRAAEELRAGNDRGPLHGIPVAIKDLIEVEGAPTGYGSKVRAPVIADADALLVQRLRQAGAIIFCKANLLEYAYGIAHPDIGQTNNPHDTGRTSGGSSGGSAALVAAGIVPLAIGTDTGGSIRIPASYCGIAGLKPSFGLVPLDGAFPLSWTLDHAGPLARDVADTALLLEALSATPLPLTPPSLSGIRIGAVRFHCESPELTPAVAANLAWALDRLAAAGVIVKQIDIPELARANSELRRIILPEASVIHAPLHAENPAGYAPRTRAQVEAGFEAKAIDYLRAQGFRAELRNAVEAAFGEVDVLIGPSVPFPSPVEDPEFTEDGEEGEMLSSGFANMTGQPSISIPSGMDGHLPLGLQLTGPLGADHRLLQIAFGVETALAAWRKPSRA
ncbi:amidase [Rhizobium sp. BG4]|uniref:amidase n=1 Tax=Rhizobium sp. BG4 TaxID=2613770 RepID=UPI00193D0842|nr:amidase [Rhizobium sp. BG4]QRM45868.1 amidase [Rhizobium sp. BG4]